MNVSKKLRKWYNNNKRQLPWRESGNPYFIWISEIILQQTRVQQGMNYYFRFIERFPTIFILSESSIEQVLKIWQGLGYYSRAQNLHKTSRIIVKEYAGKIPNDYRQLLSLPGIGEYTAGAIMSLAFNKPYPAIDGNVYRVLSRYFGVNTPIQSAKAKKEFYEIANEILDAGNPGLHNQAVIELGALICRPRKPLCHECPISDSCFALQKNQVTELPNRKRQTSFIDRYFYYLLIRKGDSLFIKQRSEGDIWALLYEFPLIETRSPLILPDDIAGKKEWKDYFSGKRYTITKISEEIKHQLSHQKIHAQFIEIETEDEFTLPLADEIKINELERYPFPRLIDNYLSENSKIVT